MELVFVGHMTISRAAQKLNIKNSTAKLIIKKYRETGSFFESMSSRKKRLEKEREAIEKEINERNILSALGREDLSVFNVNTNAPLFYPIGMTIPESYRINMPTYLWTIPFWSFPQAY